MIAGQRAEHLSSHVASAANGIRVLVLFSSGEIGGAERSITRMVMTCVDPLVRYELATVGSAGEWQRWVASEGRPAKCYGIFGKGGSVLRGVRAYVRDCRSYRPHAIYAIGLRAATVARLSRLLVPSTRIVHGIRSTFPGGSRLARSFRVSETFLCPLTTCYVANTSKGAQDLMRLVRIPPKRMHVIYNGVDLAHPVAAARRRAPAIAVVANINGYKGHEQFLEVVALVRDRVPDICVLCIGRNDLGASIVQAIKSRGLASTVKLLGYHARPDEIVRNVRVLALPSPQIEGCPTAVLEAMSMGVPVVAYAVGGLPEIMLHGESGVLIQPGDTEGFASALIDLVLDTELNDRIGQEGRRVIESRFALQACAHLHAELWRNLVHRTVDKSNGAI